MNLRLSITKFNLLLLILFLTQYSFSQSFIETFDDEKTEKWNSFGGPCLIKNQKYIIPKGIGYSLTKSCHFREFSYEGEVSVGKKGTAGLLFNVCPVNSATIQFMAIM